MPVVMFLDDLHASAGFLQPFLDANGIDPSVFQPTFRRSIWLNILAAITRVISSTR